jgi:hypothetical protein
MSEWQPIETAPKDGSQLLGWANGDYATFRWTGGYFNLIVAGTFAEDAAWWPTHWMPLPTPPSVGPVKDRRQG